MSQPISPLEPGCRMTVVVPARNEEHDVARCLAALASQADLSTFDVILLANNCDDNTAERARDFGRASRLRLHVLEATLPAATAHVGTARKMLMDWAAKRFMVAGAPHGIVATTDADTIVASDWVEQTFFEMRSVDAVAGLVEISPADQQALLAPVRLLYARETAFRRACTELESRIDPLVEDPPPRHGAFVGASFAVTAAMYGRSGGIVPLPCLEDRAFLFALRRVDAKIRHSLGVRAWTSARRLARVAGGFAAFIGHLHDQGMNGQTLSVDDPRRMIDELQVRAALRRIWRGDATDDDFSLIGERFDVDRARCAAMLDRTLPFGAAYERVITRARFPAYGTIFIDEAIASLRAAATSRKAVDPTRNRAASGAG